MDQQGRKDAVLRAMRDEVARGVEYTREAERALGTATHHAQRVSSASSRGRARVHFKEALRAAQRVRNYALEAEESARKTRAAMGGLGTMLTSPEETRAVDAAVATAAGSASKAMSFEDTADDAEMLARDSMRDYGDPSAPAPAPPLDEGAPAAAAAAPAGWLQRVADLPEDMHAWHYMGYDVERGVPRGSNVERWCPDRPDVAPMSPGRGTGWLGSALYAYTGRGPEPPVGPFPDRASNLYVLEPPMLRKVLSSGGGGGGGDGPWYVATFDEGGDDRVGTLVRGTAAWLLRRGRCSLFGALWAALPGHLTARSAEQAYRWWIGARAVALLRDVVGGGGDDDDDAEALLDEDRGAAALDAHMAARWVTVFLASRLPAISAELVLHAAEGAASDVVAEAISHAALLPPGAPLQLTQPITHFMLRLRIAGILATPGGAWANPGTGSLLYNYATASALMRLRTKYRLPDAAAAAAAPHAAKRSAADAALEDSRALTAAFVSLNA